jgi:ubiquinone/menaquinone biosynthesis C-methylase UbiE
MNLEHTGERMILEHYRSSVEDYVIQLMHIATYKFTEQFSHGKHVLDFGCGSGYGAARISEVADCVYAVDVSEAAISHAKGRYQRKNLKFICVNPDNRLPFPDQSFDTVLSFQVLEHILKVDHYLTEIQRVLIPGGLLVLVTPDRKTRLLPFQQPWNRWHVQEFSESGLYSLLSNYFQEVYIQHMSGHKDIVDVEIRRCTKLKFAMLPFTLPFFSYPQRLRILNLIHSLKGCRREFKTPMQFEFNELDITISEDAHPSLNLVVLARTDTLGMPIGSMKKYPL